MNPDRRKRVTSRAELRAELERVNAENTEERGEWSKAMRLLVDNGTYAASDIVPAVVRLIDDRDALRAENGRLREALEEIVRRGTVSIVATTIASKALAASQGSGTGEEGRDG